MTDEPVNVDVIHQEMADVRSAFAELLRTATAADLRRRSNGTRWTNRQLLWHMVFGYLVVRTLLPLVRLFAHLPPAASRGFAGVLNACSRPFHVVNYLGSCAGGAVAGRHLVGLLDRVLSALNRSLDKESAADLHLGMHFPTRWDPYFREWMTIADVYRYATEHYEAHRRQLSL